MRLSVAGVLITHVCAVAGHEFQGSSLLGTFVFVQHDNDRFVGRNFRFVQSSHNSHPTAVNGSLPVIHLSKLPQSFSTAAAPQCGPADSLNDGSHPVPIRISEESIQ
jgi:hypothetical protein